MTTAYATEVSDVQDLPLLIQKGSDMIHMTPDLPASQAVTVQT